jgi:hypothetical protein
MAKAKKDTKAKAPAKGAAKESKSSAKEPKGAKAKVGAKGADAKGVDPKGAAAAADASKRKLGLRGAAPWAARHAAKHAAEARARAAEPPLPGSARATIRIPVGAEDIKKKIGDLHNALTQIKGLKKNVGRSFYDIGSILKDIRERRLYEAKGYGTFEAFLEREIDLGKAMGIRLIRVVTTFLKDAAQEYGLDKVMLAMTALDAGLEGAPSPDGRPSQARIPPAPISTASLPLKPPGRA